MAKRKKTVTLDATVFEMTVANLIAAFQRLHNEDPDIYVSFTTEDEGYYNRFEVAKIELKTTLNYHQVLKIIS